MKMPKIIGFAGKMRSGKTQSALYLTNNYGYVKLSAADSLKALCAKLLDVDVENLNELKNISAVISVKPDDRWVNVISEETGIAKDIISADLMGIVFTNVRDILQYIGTDIIRKHNKNWHVDRLREDISTRLEKGFNVVIDDIRFPNEWQLIKDFGGEVYFVIRSNYNLYSTHESENGLNENMFDDEHIIYNNKTIKHLNKIVEKMVIKRGQKK